MTPVNGIVRNGKIEIPASSEFAEGEMVRVWLEPLRGDRDDAPMSEEEIRTSLEAMDRMEPVAMTDVEYSQWRKAIAEQRVFDNPSMESQLAKLQSDLK